MKNILIVEDEPDIQELLCAYLRDAGYETVTAGDGAAALSLFRSKSFDLILLDIMLPKIDGFGVCEAIRRQPPAVSGPNSHAHRSRRRRPAAAWFRSGYR